MLKQLHDAAKRVLELREGQHSLGEEIEAFAHLAEAVDGAAAELKAARKSAKKPASKKA